MSKTTISAKNIPTGFQTILAGKTHGYLADEPIELNGTGLGFSPSELLLASLSACKAMTIRFFARRQGWTTLDDVDVFCEMETEKRDGKTFTQIKTQVKLTGDLTDEQRGKLVAVADKCPVQRILTGEISMDAAVEMA